MPAVPIVIETTGRTERAYDLGICADLPQAHAEGLLDGGEHTLVLGHTSGHRDFAVDLDPTGEGCHTMRKGLVKPGYDIREVLPRVDQRDDLCLGKDHTLV